MAKINKVLYNIDQTGDTTSDEKAQARANIGAGTGNTNITRYDLSGTAHDVDLLKVYQRSINNGEFMDGMTSLGSTIPTPTLSSDEGKVPVSYYRDGRGYFLLEQYKDPRFPDSSSSDYNKVLTVNAGGQAVWQTPTVGATDFGVYELTVTKVLNGTSTRLWGGDNLTEADLTESFVNCTAATTPVRIILDSYGRLMTGLRNGYHSITCESHTFVSPDANFATELGMWGFDDLCQVVAGMNRTWYLTDGSLLDQNGIRSETETLKSGTLTIKFDFVFQV